jgi:hypothetical protein
MDQYLDFVSLEPELYTLNKRGSYNAINGAGLGETEIRNVMTSMSTGLLSVLQNMGAIPVIRCAPVNNLCRMFCIQSGRSALSCLTCAIHG